MFRFLPQLVVFILFLGSCHTSNDKPIDGESRIVSLCPGITNTIIHAGFGELIVGKSSFCFFAEKSIPAVGDLREIDFEKLLQLNATDVFVQKTASGIDPHLQELADKGEFTLHVFPIDRVQEVQDLHRHIHMHFGGVEKDILLLQTETSTLPSKVLILTEGTAGTAGLCFGKETYIDDILAFSGIENAVERPG